MFNPHVNHVVCHMSYVVCRMSYEDETETKTRITIGHSGIIIRVELVIFGYDKSILNLLHI